MKILINQVWDLTALMQPSAQLTRSALEDYSDPITWLRENDFEISQRFCHQDPNSNRIEIECSADIPPETATYMLMRWPHLQVPVDNNTQYVRCTRVAVEVAPTVSYTDAEGTTITEATAIPS